MNMYSEEEEIRLLNMRRSWHQNRRTSSAFSLLSQEDENDLFAEKSLHSNQLEIGEKFNEISESLDLSLDGEIEELEDDLEEENLNEVSPTTILDASTLDDIPAKYVINTLARHQLPVIGVYADKRIVPGFKYSVTPLSLTKPKKSLFGGKALTLKSIGRGYARRFTFSEESPSLEETCFWSDNNPEGYSFELRAVNEGDKFTVYDVNHEPQGSLEVLKIDGKQVEIDGDVNNHGIEKRVEVKMIVEVDFYDGITHSLPVNGTAVYVKKHNEKSARIVKILNVNINHHRFYLIPGFEKSSRWIRVNGNQIDGIPTKYTIKGIESHELPVVGTYVDSRILPGFMYKIRPVNSKKHLFGGKPLKLSSIGQGYAKRFTFDSDSKLENDNYFWSDNNLEGYAFETRAVFDKTSFAIISNDQAIGEAKVFRSDLPQIEYSTKRETTDSGEVVFVKRVHVDLLCHVKMDIKNSGSVDESLMKLHGLAVVKRKVNERAAKLEKIENVALDSQINLIFARTKANLTFVPIN